MPDDRPLREKLEAMANQTASPQEAEVARLMLQSIDRSKAPVQSTRILTRADVLAQPSSHRPIPVTIRMSDGTLLTVDVDYPWQAEMVRRMYDVRVTLRTWRRP